AVSSPFASISLMFARYSKRYGATARRAPTIKHNTARDICQIPTPTRKPMDHAANNNKASPAKNGHLVKVEVFTSCIMARFRATAGQVQVRKCGDIPLDGLQGNST